MNRRQKIIVSVTGIFLVLLLLVGLTYAYFLTQITGNTNDKSISLTTADLKVQYGENSAVVITSPNIMPDSNSVIATKTFTVTNTGNSESTYSIVFDEIENTLYREEDMQYKLYDTTSGTDVKIKEGYIITSGRQVIVPSVTIAYTQGTNSTHSYKVELTYIEAGVDQSIDMNKKLSFRVNIEEAQITWDTAPKGTLLYALKNSGISTTQLTVPGVSVSETTEKVMLSTLDNHGTSYYYRGAVDSNYVNFANMCWRIVRVLGDGSIRMILQDQDDDCKTIHGLENGNADKGNWYIPNANNFITGTFGYEDISGEGNDYWRKINYLNSDSSGLADALKKFQNTKLKEYTQYLKKGDWCLDDTAYDRYQNVLTEVQKETIMNEHGSFSYWKFGNNLKCNVSDMLKFGDNITPMYVGTLTADEVVFAGGALYDANNSYYLIYNSFTDDFRWWTLSPYLFDVNIVNVLSVMYSGALADANIHAPFLFRPAVTLKANTLIKTDGTGVIDNPYEILVD